MLSASGRLKYCALFAAALSMVASSANAQFGSFPFPVPTSKAQADALTDPGCAVPKKKKGLAVLGKIAGNVAGRALSKTAMSRFVPMSEFTTTLTEGIACRLDPEEQKQAATATDEVLRGNKVGASTTWTSESRQNVTGTSTVTASAPPPAGERKTKCMIVTDVVIVDGEETKAEKRMCKGPGQPRYVIANA
jgi:surface antigen